MSRSLKKAPYVEEKLFNRIEAMNAKIFEFYSQTVTYLVKRKPFFFKICLC